MDDSTQSQSKHTLFWGKNFVCTRGGALVQMGGGAIFITVTSDVDTWTDGWVTGMVAL